MGATTTVFDSIQESLASGGVEKCLARLIEELEGQQRFQEAFEARKMLVRRQFGLPVLTGELPGDLSDEQRQELEDRLISAYREIYREVGLAMFRTGQLSQGWTLLEAAGEEAAAAGELAAVEVNEENLEQFIDVALHHGAAPALGFAAVLEHYGTCNAITTYDQMLHNRPLADRQAAAALLVDHLTEELRSAVKADIARREGESGGKICDWGDQPLGEMVASREWLFEDGAYHIDTTHLASTVRFARVLEDEPLLRKAIDLTEYGRRLTTPYQNEGEEPFKEVYPSHALLFHAMLGERVDEAAEYFRGRAEAVDVREEGSAAVEVYISLLHRLGRNEEAVQATIELLPPGVYTQGLAPTLFELCEQSSSFQPLIDACRERDDLLGFTVGLIQQEEKK